jgi:hypothetical protein
VKGILRGYASLMRELLGLRNDASFLSLPARLTLLIVVCSVIGLLRNALSVALDDSSRLYSYDPGVLWLLGIRPKFYSFDPDIVWVMLNFPVQLFLFPAALLHWQLQALGYRRVETATIFALSFNLQVLHLIVPFFDWLGFKMGMPWQYTIGDHKVATQWYINFLVMSPGIILAWLLTAYIVAKVLRQRLGIRWPAVILTSLTTFVVILMPTYFFFPTFNTLFARAFGVLTWNPEDPRIKYPILIQWGYGTYFALTALLGLIYYLKRRSKGST